MKDLIRFIEIPSTNFMRAVQFYEKTFDVSLAICDEYSTEKMAFFPHHPYKPNMAIAWATDFLPSTNGVLVSLQVESIENTLLRIHTHGGKTLRPKTKIQADGLGYFAHFADSEGNTLGLYSEQ